MYTRSFFLIGLLIPLLCVAPGFLMSLAAQNGLYIHLALILLMPYALFALLTGFLSRLLTPSALRRFAYRSPLIFLTFMIGYLLLEYAFDLSLANTYTGLIAIMIFAATYVVIVGYLYILVLQHAFVSYLFQQRRKNREEQSRVHQGKLRC